MVSLDGLEGVLGQEIIVAVLNPVVDHEEVANAQVRWVSARLNDCTHEFGDVASVVPERGDLRFRIA